MKRRLLTLLLTVLTGSTAIAQSPKQVILRGGTATNVKIPAGTTSLTVEAWGAGGGGSILGGGQGGGYFRCTVQVKPNDDLSINVGVGGIGGTSRGENGNNTTFTVQRLQIGTTNTQTVYNFVAQGGTGSNNGVPAGSYINDQTQFAFNLPMNYSFIGSTGGNGNPTTVPAVAARPDAIVLATSVGGDGGDGANSSNTKGIGGSETQLLKVNSPLLSYGIYGTPFINKLGPSPGLMPGGGGGGATVFNQNNVGANGGPGLVIVSYTN